MDTEIGFPVKTISWSHYEQQTPILLQEENGPCPLIALVNTLLLQEDIETRNAQLTDSAVGTSALLKPLDIGKLRNLLKKHAGSRVPLAKVLACLGDMLLDMAGVDSAVVHRLLQNLPLLHTGLSVNPNLVTGDFPPNDLPSEIFGVFGLPLLHGWRWHDEGLVSTPVFRELQTFDALQDFLLEDNGNDTARLEVQNWLLLNGTQLTQEGLRKLDTTMATDLLAVFFRNNHFSTLYKADHHDFYLLLTDEAFTKTSPSRYVWQSLISASGSDDLFFTGDFRPIADGEDYTLEPSTNDDLELVRRLQEDEDAAIAQQMQSNFDSRRKPKPKSRQPNGATSPLLDKKTKKQEKQENSDAKQKKSKPVCVIV